jgi:hypothetical protein
MGFTPAFGRAVFWFVWVMRPEAEASGYLGARAEQEQSKSNGKCKCKFKCKLNRNDQCGDLSTAHHKGKGVVLRPR